VDHKPNSVAEYLLEGKAPERVALRFLKAECTYGSLALRSSGLAAGLLRLGMRKGDRAILISDNSPFWVESYLGILRAGLVCIPLAGGIQQRELDDVVAATEAGIVFAQSAALRILKFPGMHLVTEGEVPFPEGCLSCRSLEAPF